MLENILLNYLLHTHKRYTNIAKQIEIEDAILKQPLSFLDTDLIVCKVWRVQIRQLPPLDFRTNKERHYDYYLLCDIDSPWQNDGMREHPNHRQELLAIYEKELKGLNKPTLWCLEKKNSNGY